MAKGRYGKMTVKEAIEKLREVDIIIKRTDTNEFRVNFRGGSESTAYYTNDLDDAVATELSMGATHCGSNLCKVAKPCACRCRRCWTATKPGERWN